MRQIIAVLAGVLVLAGCTGGSVTAGGPALPDRVAVFGPDDLRGHGIAERADRRPTATEVLAADRVLRPRVAAVRDAGVTQFAQYYRQYAGLPGGAIAVNAMCSVRGDNWRWDWIVVADGGACYWSAVVRGGVVEEFVVNGLA